MGFQVVFWIASGASSWILVLTLAGEPVASGASDWFGSGLGCSASGLSIVRGWAFASELIASGASNLFVSLMVSPQA